MKKFEYTMRTMVAVEAIHVTNELNNLGRLGWEVCGVSGGIIILKRELPKPTKLGPR